MKVLVINTVPFEKNGISMVIRNCSLEMKKIDHNLNLVIIANNVIDKDFEEEFSEIGIKYILLQNRKRKPIAYLINIYKIIKKFKFDIVHIHGNSALMLLELVPAWLAGCKIRIVHSHNTTCDFKFLNKICMPFFLRLGTYKISCGIDAGKWLYKGEDFFVLNNGIQLNDFIFCENKRDTIRAELNIDNDTFLVGHIGGFVHQKNHKFIINIAEKLKNNEHIKFVLIGDGPLKKDITNEIKTKKLKNILILNSTNNISSYYNAFDCFILPSLFEGLPLVMIEAQANGLICLVSSKIDIKSNICDNVEFMCMDEDIYKERILKLSKLAHLPVKRENRSNEAISQLQNTGFSIQANAKELLCNYKAYME